MTIEGYDKPVTYEPFQYLDYLPLGGDCRLGKGPDRRPFLACRVDGPIQILKLEIAGFRARPSVEHEEPITAGQDGERRLARAPIQPSTASISSWWASRQVSSRSAAIGSK